MKIKKTVFISTAAGLALFLALIMREGIHDILAVLSIAGWGLVGVALYRIVPLTLDSLGWARLIPRQYNLSAPAIFGARWVAEAFNTLLPMAQVGGHVIRARMISRYGMPAMNAAATVMVDFTVGIATQFIFIVIGIIFLGWLGHTAGEAIGLVTGMAVAFLLLLGFYLTQRIGFFSFGAKFIHKLTRGRQFASMVGGAETLDQKIAEAYQQHRQLAACGGLRLLAWLSKSGEVMLALFLLGAPVSFGKAMVLESLSIAVTSAAFFIPGALGVREGGILVIGSQIGLSPDVALALALIKRGREAVVGVPGLLYWLYSEGRLLRKNADRSRNTPGA